MEDKEHILTCPDTKAHEKWELSSKQLGDGLKSKGTDRNID